MIRVATYTRTAPGEGRPAAKLARRQARLAAAVRSWPRCVHIGAYADCGPIPPLGRPGLAQLMADASAACFDVVVAEHLERLCPRSSGLRAVVDQFAAFGVRSTR